MWLSNVVVSVQGFLGIAAAAGWIVTRETRALRRVKLMSEVWESLPDGSVKESLAREIEQSVAAITTPPPVGDSSRAGRRDALLFWSAVGLSVLGVGLDVFGVLLTAALDVASPWWTVGMMALWVGIVCMLSGLLWANSVLHRIELRRAVLKSIAEADKLKISGRT